LNPIRYDTENEMCSKCLQLGVFANLIMTLTHPVFW